MPGRKTAFLPQEEFDRIRSNYSRFNEPWLKEEVEELKSMAADNVSHEQMSKPAQPRWTEEDDRLVVQMYDQGVSFEDMAKHFNRSEKAIVARLVNLRVRIFDHV